MAKLIISCDEKWPVFDLEVPEEGQEPNCDIPEEIYKQYLYIANIYSKMQNILKVYHEVARRNDPEYEKMRERCYECFRESAKATADTILNHKVTTPTERELWPVLFENLTRLHRASQTEQ